MNEDMAQARQRGVHCLCDGLALTSAYARGQGRDPAYTCIDGAWRGLLDYILISESLSPCRLLEVPALGDGALPSAEYPSDHLAIAVELAIANGDSGSAPEGLAPEAVAGAPSAEA